MNSQAMGFGNPGSPGTKPPLEKSTKIFVEKDGVTTSPAAWARQPQPGGLRDWISQDEFDYYMKDFEEHGWNGGLSWYRVMDLNAMGTPQLVGKKATQPCQFITGTNDVVVAMLGRDEKGEMSIEKGLERLPMVLANATEQPIETVIIPGVGHWVQQEAPELVNKELLAFVGKHKALFADGAPQLAGAKL